MFSMKSTWKEIKTTKPVDTALGDLFPTCWSILLQGHEEETMEQIHDRVHMEWGEAFWSQPLVNCANMLMETAEKQKFLFVPLWHTQKEGWIPKEDQNDEEGVWLFTGNPDVDQQAFMHFDDCAPFHRIRLPLFAKNEDRKRSVRQLFSVREADMRCFLIIRKVCSLHSAWSVTEAIKHLF